MSRVEPEFFFIDEEPIEIDWDKVPRLPSLSPGVFVWQGPPGGHRWAEFHDPPD